jgi:hypothetical protein
MLRKEPRAAMEQCDWLERRSYGHDCQIMMKLDVLMPPRWR